MEKKAPVIRRRQYLINKRFQFKYTFLVIIFMFSVAVLTGWTIYHTAWALFGERISKIYPYGRFVYIMKEINFVLLTRLLLITPFVFLMSVLLTHRIAGPQFRITKYLYEMADGNFSSMLKLRKYDELKDIMDAVNAMREGLRKNLKENADLISSMETKLNSIKESYEKGMNEEQTKAMISDFSQYMSTLKDRLLKYQL